MKPKVLIAMSTLNCGGIEKSLVTLLQAIDYELIDVTLLLDRKCGIFLNKIPKNVKIKEIPYSIDINKERIKGRKNILLSKLLKLRLGSLYRYYKIFSKEKKLPIDDLIIQRTRRHQNNLSPDEVMTERYDLAVAYADIEQMILVLDRIYANKKIAFFHTQIEGITHQIHKYIEVFKNFDSLYCVSKDLTASLKSYFPELSNKIYTFPHIINVDEIRSGGNEYNAQWRRNCIRILSVGRVQPQKGFDLIPEIADNLRNIGIIFEWIIIGDGPQHDAINKKLSDLGLGNYVKFVGVVDNPYPYFASCDIYVQPSRYEGYCLTLAEARVFARPIVSTHFDGSDEQLEGGKYGVLVDCNVDDIFVAVKELCLSADLREHYSSALKRQNIGSSYGAEIFLNEANKSIL